MISVIGAKRLFILLFLLALNVCLAALAYLYIMPEEYSSSQRLKALRSEVSGIQSDIQRMQIEFEQLGLQQNDFEELKASGFFKLQTRNEAKSLFQIIQAQSGVVSAVASVKPGVIEENDEAQKAKHKILASKIEINIAALDDTSIYKYILLAQNNFIGHLSLDSIHINRVADVTPQVLKAISMGSNPELVNAKIVMTWRTMIPETQVINDQVQE